MQQDVGSVIAAIHTRFEQADLSFGHGFDSAWDEAVALVLHVCGRPDQEESLGVALAATEVAEIERLAAKRVSDREPLVYLLGQAQYVGLPFKIKSGVVVPRSPIGFLLPDEISPWQPQEPASVLDLCAGSGCLGIVAAYAYPQAEVTLVELDPRACELAEENVALHDLGERVRVVQGDATTVEHASVDLLISNPPYVDAADMRTLPAEFRAEPAAGLGAGEDGLSIMLPIIARLGELLNPGGLMLGEVGASAAALIRRQPDLPLVWLDLPQGGEGVFLLEADALNSHTARQQ